MGLCGLRSLGEVGPDMVIRRQTWSRMTQSNGSQPGKRS
jgi:hypothetical protein